MKDKTIIFPLDLAKKLYKEGGTGKKFALSFFNKEELTRTEVAKRWEDLPIISGFYISEFSETLHMEEGYTISKNKNVFATKKQAESALAMAMLSQLMKQANGDWEPRWSNGSQFKYVITRIGSRVTTSIYTTIYQFLAFKDQETADEFLENHRELIDTYHMI